MTRPANEPSIRGRQGTRAGIVSRLLANGLDLLAAVAIGMAVLLAVSAVAGLFTRSFTFLTPSQPARGILAAALLVVYLGYGWGLGGRTFGKTVLGLRVVDRAGGDISTGRGLLRAVLYLVFPPGLLWSVVSRRNASLQDLILGTAVVHDWGFVDTHAAVTHAARLRG